MPDPRSRRIVETAVRLAEEGGFEAVRLRDVASESGVALGTLYTRFKSKEDILIAALETEVDKLVQMTALVPPAGDTPTERVRQFFGIATRAMFMRPNFARAVLKAVASGEPDLSGRVANFHGVVTELIVAALHGSRTPGGEHASDEEKRLGFLMQQVWFASLVGWVGGLHDEQDVFDQMHHAVGVVLASYSESEAREAGSTKASAAL